VSDPRSYQRFFAELKRRKVFRVAAVYGAAAFAVLEASDILFPRFGFEDWTVTFVAVLSLLGFPVALVLAWVYERTPGGVRRTEEAEAGELETIAAAPAARRWPVGLAAAAGTALLLLSVWWTLGRPASSPDAAATAAPADAAYASIAVLPFANMSEDPSDEYFSDGLTEELLNALARVPDLKVAARTSSFAYKGENQDLREVGEALGVETILEGSVRRAGGRVRVTAQLIDAADGFHVWSSDWDRELTAENVFDIQDEIAGTVARALASGTAPDAEALAGAGTLPAGSGRVPAQVRTADLETYDLYLLGRQGWASRTPDGLQEAVGYFEAAIERDSSYVPAWVGLAAAYNALPAWSEYPVQEGGQRSEFAARRALELDPDNAEALYTLATTLYEYQLAFDEAERLYARAMQLDPDYSSGLTWFGQMRWRQGRFEEALAWTERAVELDPLSLHAVHSNGMVLMSLERWGEALAEFDRALAIQPDFYPALRLASLAEAYLGDWEGAEARLRRAIAAGGKLDADELAREMVAGARDPAQKGLTVSAVRHLLEPPRVIGPADAVEWLLLVDDRQAAIDGLESWVEETYPTPVRSLLSLVGIEKLAGEPRFAALVESVGMSEYLDNLEE
jgi:TolB-like protein/Tfp pilus assembly protein PilF